MRFIDDNSAELAFTRLEYETAAERLRPAGGLADVAIGARIRIRERQRAVPNRLDRARVGRDGRGTSVRVKLPQGVPFQPAQHALECISEHLKQRGQATSNWPSLASCFLQCMFNSKPRSPELT